MFVSLISVLWLSVWSVDVSHVDRMGNYNITYDQKSLSGFTVFVDNRLLQTNGTFVLKTLKKE